ncbi:hypothetical protein BH09BAC3_BH09BAC3_29140 [soil metagenome]
MKTYALVLFILLNLTTTYSSIAQTKPDTLKYCVKESNIGVGGFDPVSYFQGAPKSGSADLVTVIDGVIYRFSSAENQKKFKADPSKYLPQFGGWCSMTLAMGRATTPKYDNFVILKNKLYLFERTVSVNGRELWLSDPKTNEKTAGKNYSLYRTTGRIN